MGAIFFATWVGVVAAQIAPGPNMLAVVSVALSQGRRAAICVAAGVATGVVIWVLAFAFGLSRLFHIYPSVSLFMQLLGGAYLLYLGMKAMLAARKTSVEKMRAAKRQFSLFQAYKRGLFVVLTNPKAALMWVAVTAFMLGSGLEENALLLFAPIASLSALAIYGCYAVLFSSQRVQSIYLNLTTYIEFAFGAIFGLLGGKLLFDSVSELGE